MISDAKVLEDRFSVMDAGMNSNLVYSLLPKNQSSLLVNATVRGGMPQCRPGFKRRPLTFESDGTQTAFEQGNWQGAEFYEAFDGVSCILVSISGRIYQIRLDNFTVTHITPTGDANSPNVDYVYFQQAEQYMVIQDNQSLPFIFDGVSLRRSNPSESEVPVGTSMAYGMGRLWVANGRQYIAGDILGGPTSILQFTENTFINEGGAFTVPLQSGNITSMSFIANLNTTLGEGALMVATEDAVFSVQVPLDRTTWKDVTNPLATVAQMNYGSVGHQMTPVNGDLFFRSRDGIRSLIVGVRNFGQWGNVPISTEMANPLDTDNQQQLNHVTNILFDNRLLLSAVPTKTVRGIAFRGLIALDFNLISSLRGDAPPSYDGIWNGLTVLKLIKAKYQSEDRAFAFNVNADSKIDLWELTKSDRFDDVTKPIQWIIEGPGLNFGNPTELKQLFYGDTWVDRIAGNVDFVVSYRPDHYFTFVDWCSFSKCGNYQTCITEDCTTPQEPREQYRPRVRFPQPGDGCESSADKPFNQFYEMQVRLQMTGYCRMLGTRIFARQLEEAAVGDCPGDEACTTESGCNPDPYSYSSAN